MPRKIGFISKVRLVASLIFIFYSSDIFSYTQNQDSLQWSPSPRKASIFSAVIPGLGQAYNKRYWKIPVIYAGFASLGYFAYNTNTTLKGYKQAYIAEIDTIPSTINTTPYERDGLLALQSKFKRRRDLFIIGTFVFYIINIVDASVDAHLYIFKTDKDLSIGAVPLMLQSGITPGLSIRYKF